VLWKASLLPGLATALVTLLLTPLVIRLAYRLRAIDVPGGRKRHDRSTPRLGGVAILGGIVVVLGPALALFTPAAFQGLRAADFYGFTLAAGLVFCLGLADDVLGLRAPQKLGVQILAAFIVVSMGWQFDTLRLPLEGSFQLGALAPVLSVLWIVGVMNAINFIDGLDGLAAGMVAIIGGSLLVLALFQGSPQTVVVTSCIVGACLGFLRHNWCPAKIYMGDSGSLLLGFLLATISLRSSPSVKASAAIAILVPVLALGLPVIDTLLVMWYRFLRGHKTMNRVARMLRADRAHLHHLLLDGKTERRRVMVILFGMAAGFCAMALLVAASGSWLVGMGFLVVEFAAVVLVRRIGMTGEARRLARQQMARLSMPGKPSDIEPRGRHLEKGAGIPLPPADLERVRSSVLQ
jgi:UDP-GlcNAc:undecaprenyl-phosphate/decaprenyl-phosphate GlcNAc-1-phosphate transferase